MKIPVCTPILTGDEWKYVKDCLETNWISSKGKYVDQFEEGTAKYLGVKYGAACTSATVGLHLALVAAKIKQGDEVIVPAFNIISLVNAVIWVGAKPVLVDCEPETGNIDPVKIEEKITDKTKVIVAVHLYGHPCEMDKIIDLAEKYKLLVIEDMAEAFGAEYKNKKIGGIGDIGVLSFYANKIITTGEGGMVISNDKEIVERVKSLRNMAYSLTPFKHYEIGFNYRMTNITAAIGVAQLEKADQLIEARRKNAQEYNKLLKDVPGIVTPIEKDYAKNVYWMYIIQVTEKFPLNKKELAEKLLVQGIETRDFFYPMHEQPVFIKMGLFRNEEYPMSEKLHEQGLVLPSSGNLTQQEIEYISNIIKGV